MADMQAHDFKPDPDASSSREARCAPWLPGPRDGFARIPVWLLTGLGLVLRLVRVGDEALWFDEVNTLWRAAGGSLGRVVSRIAGDVQAPLFDLITWAWTRGATITDAGWVRFPSVLFSTALIPVTACLARELGLRRRAQIVAAACVSFAPFQLRFAQEARPYALLALLAGVLLLAAARIAATGGRRGLLLLAITGPLLVMTHYYGVLAWLAIVAALLLDAAACQTRLPRMLASCLPALVALLLWSPVAWRQFQLKEMNGVYGPLDGKALLELLDAGAMHAPLTASPESLAGALGGVAGAAPAAVWIGRVLLLALLVAGAWGCWRIGRCRVAGVSCRGPAAALLAVAGLLLLGGSLVPASAWADVASAVFKGGRPLDAENLAALQQLRSFAPRLAGGVVIAACLVLVVLPAWVRRGGWRLPAPAWPVLAISLPLLAVAVLDRTGKHTLATRNLIGLAAPCAVLVAAGTERLRTRSAAAERIALGVLASLLLVSLFAYPVWSAKADWNGAALAVEGSGAEPLAAPPWIARCVEFHTHRPWNTVFGSRNPEEVRAWLASRQRVMLVRQFDDIEDNGPVVAELTARFGPPVVGVFRGGLRCELYGAP